MDFGRRVLLAGLAGVAAAPALAQPAPAPGKSGTDKAPLARRLADYSGSLRAADLDAATIERTKVHLLDSLGCGIAAFKEGTVSAVRELAFASGGNAATIIGTKRRATLEWAAVTIALSGHLAMNQTRLGALSNWKGLAGPDAARNAIFAVQRARAGITGPSPIFEGEAGFFKQVSGPLDIDTASFGGRGKRFRIYDCFIKSYPAQAQTQTAVPAAAKIAQSAGDLSRIRAIEVKSTHMGWLMAGSMPERWAPKTSETADHSLPYIVAHAMLDGTITTASYAPEALSDPKTAALLKLITVREDPTMTALVPKQSPNSVTSTLNDGRVITERVDDLP